MYSSKSKPSSFKSKVNENVGKNEPSFSDIFNVLYKSNCNMLQNCAYENSRKLLQA